MRPLTAKTVKMPIIESTTVVTILLGAKPANSKSAIRYLFAFGADTAKPITETIVEFNSIYLYSEINKKLLLFTYKNIPEIIL